MASQSTIAPALLEALYVTEVRDDAAYHLLKRADAGHRVGDVAAQLGFTNVSRFRRQYRDRFGLLP